MPELPEVETVRRMLGPRLVSQRIQSIELLRPDFVQVGRERHSQLVGATVGPLKRHGKFLFLPTDADLTVVLHLGMTGHLGLVPPHVALAKHTHVVWHFEGTADTLRHVDPRRFGRMEIYATESLKTDSPLARLGVDALRMNQRMFRRALREHSRAIKVLLLDQTIIAGLGNIYIDEALFQARIHPLAVCNRLDDSQCLALFTGIKKVLQASIRSGGSSIDDFRQPDGRKGWYQIRHQVYGRRDEPCRKCGHPISTMVIGGRTTHFCQICQFSNT